ncbi:hypothetical protein DCAR_0625678 [Daucus carota subsp. sativus]|uniref:GTD-binding domain-containing protein n=1 Tax=Daucus carota subsp. sativus TaxID=79200 RepID=A0AAF0XDW3_DAUCS|nr:PREDICTED: myosin-binding protein 7-like [Daucus carota subsp. sativus]WOH06255.1 hypothetical protein DCAR_0625678 [Daucus carota subsp. sativus]
MELEIAPHSTSRVQCGDCECDCSTMNRSSSGTWLRTVKRKYGEFEVEKEEFEIPGLDIDISQVAKVELGNECFMLREMVTNQQESINELSVELEKERNASSSSANEAMSMILRLQREKAEVQMELRQFKRYAEEKIAHDGEEILALEELLYKKDEVIESLTCEIEAYKNRLMSYGIMDREAEGEKGVVSRENSTDSWEGSYDIPTYDYPPIKCSTNENQVTHEVKNDVADVENVVGDRPPSRDDLKDLEYRINQLEQSPTQSQPDVEAFATNNVLEKVIVGHSPRPYRHVRRSSNDSSSSIPAIVKETSSDITYDLGSAKKKECVHVHVEEYPDLRNFDISSEVEDDMSDRVYTVDSVHGVPYNSVTEQKVSVGTSEDYVTKHKEPLYAGDLGDPEIKRLYTRLQALEADRESMRQALISIGTEKAQLVLLKEIAQQLCQDMSPARTLPVRKTSVISSFSIFSFFKWIVSFVFWRRKVRQPRYTFGMSPKNIGLLTLLDKGPYGRPWRSISSTKIGSISSTKV